MTIQRIVGWIKQNRLLAGIVGIQIIMFLWLMGMSLRTPQNVTIIPGESEWTGGPEVEMQDDGSILLVPTESEGQTYGYTLQPSIALPAGGYEITVDYEVVDSKVDIPTYVSQGGGVPQYGIIKCATSDAYDMVLKSAQIILYHGKTQAVGRVWGSVLSNISDVKIQFAYNNNATIAIKAIRIEEQLIYRVTRLLGYLLSCLLVDGVIFYLSNQKIDEKKRYLLLSLTGIAVVASLPCFADHLFSGTDLEYHLLRIGAIAEELKNGQFPVRLQTDAVNGAGYITPVFYSDFFLYIPAVLYLLMVPLQTCYQIYVVLVNIATTAASYFSFSKMFRSERLGVLGTILYVFAADRMQSVLVGASVGKYTALIFLPLIALGVYNILESKDKMSFKEYMPLVVGLTGIIQSHILTCEMIVVFAILFFVIHIREFLLKERLVGLIKAGMLTLALNLFFILPFLMSWMTMDINVKMREGNIKSQGAYPMQLFSIFPSTNGWFNPMTMQGDTSVTMGVALVIGGVVFLLCMMRSKAMEIEQERSYIYGKRMLGYGCLALFMCTVYFPWEIDLGPITNILSAVQFPPRYLEIVTITFTILALCVVKILWKRSEPKYAVAVSAVLVLFTVLTAGYYYSNATNGLMPYRVYTYEELNTMNLGGGSEYIPGKWADVNMLTAGEPVAKGENIEVISYEKEGMVTTLTCKNTGEEAYVELPLLCYNNYVVRDISTGESMLYQKNDMSAMEVLLPAGYDGSIEIFYEAPMIWHVAEVISLLTAISLLGYKVILPKVRKKR